MTKAYSSRAAKTKKMHTCVGKTKLIGVIIDWKVNFFYPGPNINGLGVGHWGQRIVDGGLKEKGKSKTRPKEHSQTSEGVSCFCAAVLRQKQKC